METKWGFIKHDVYQFSGNYGVVLASNESGVRNEKFLGIWIENKHYIKVISFGVYIYINVRYIQPSISTFSFICINMTTPQTQKCKNTWSFDTKKN